MNDRWVSLAVVVVLILGAFPFLVTILPENARASSLFVGGIGSDNYTTIQGAINAANAGDTIFVYSGTYRENIAISKSLSLVAEDRDATIVDGRDDTSVFYVNADSVTITGFTITNSSHHWFVTHAGIVLYDSRDCIISNNTFFFNLIGIYLDQSDNNLVMNNDISGNVAGISLERSHWNTIAHNQVSNEHGGIGLIYSTNNTITNNVLIDSYVEIVGNQLNHWNTHTIGTTNTLNGQPVQYWKNAVSGVVPTGAGQVILANTTNVIVEDQVFDKSPVGIQMGFSSGNLIRRNTFHPNNVHGIRAQYSVGYTIEGNTFMDNSYSMHIIHSSDFTVTGNNIVGDFDDVSWETGIHLDFASDAYLNENSICGTTIGVTMQNSHHITLANNEISSNKDAGLKCHICDNITMSGNRFSLNGLGVHLRNVEDSLIYHNSFNGNAMQAFDDKDSNSWDDGYPSAGNYWSDYLGRDERWGPDQDRQGPDGIGDSPRIIDADTSDRYPLMAPFHVVDPRPPVGIRAELEGANLEDVRISWDVSPDDGAGRMSVVGYEIYRGSLFRSNGVGYAHLASLPSRSTQIVDSHAGEGDSNSYFYRICALDFTGNETCALIQAGKFTRSLWEGMNLISIPLTLTDSSIGGALQTLSFSRLWTYDPWDASDPWKEYSESKPHAGLNVLGNDVGYWVDVGASSRLTIAGTVPLTTEVRLRGGWNLVGFPSFDIDFTVADFKSINILEVEGFDSAASPYFLRELQDSEFLQAGQAYWVEAPSGGIWHVDNL
jgi:nitrous oxidase accessory protein